MANTNKRIATLRPVYVDIDLHHKFKIHCVANQEQIKDVTARLIEQHLKRSKK